MAEQEYQPPWDELDEGIRETVSALWNAGLVTTASCQGGEGHVARQAFVNVAANPDELKAVGARCAAVLVAIGWVGFDVCRITRHQGSVALWEVEPSYVSLELWGKKG